MSLSRYLGFFFKNNLRQNFQIIRKLDDEKHGLLVGTDSFGNQYYENNEERYGRHRWVLPHASVPKSDATQVPPGWNQWLHCFTDEIPKMDESGRVLKDHFWATNEVVPNKTGTRGAYKVYSTASPTVQPWTPTVSER
ncbi:NADH dehydrogenase [ubiquinone] 1 alpha subcomplex subunit 12 [Smittium mucronatum]|uniref:NADH dehydrogenase [ubiquinone] 1 alpha subcomplex subunit n=1 Tax=Smittium mucronatum TaxID=133383 RepID=A0A1R0GMN4_9FUNG|nr:NADH dehydrogenase [ubiquinone] 1 alpha subcomplex subunit 12 [Smittium mucronatum]